MKIMATTYSFVCAGTPVETKKGTKQVSRMQSFQSTDIHNNLMHKDVIQLSDGLARLEELLKSGTGMIKRNNIPAKQARQVNNSKLNPFS